MSNKIFTHISGSPGGSYCSVEGDVLACLQDAIINGDIDQALSYIDQAPIAGTALPNGELPLVLAIRKGDKEIVSRLLSTGQFDLLKKDDQGLTPVDHAVIHSNQDVLAAVLSYKISKSLAFTQQIVSSDYRSHSLSIEFENELIATRNPPKEHLPPLHRAALRGKIDTLKILLAGTVDVNWPSPEGMLPLHYAALGGNKKAVELLLQAGARADLLSSSGNTVLHYAALASNREVLDLLLQKCNAINFPNNSGYTPLHFAATQENFFNVQFLIEKGADPLKECHSGLTPLAIMTALSLQRGALRDPLKVDVLQTLMFAGIVSSWLASYLSGDEAIVLANVAMILADYSSLMSLVRNTQSSFGAIATLAANTAISYVPGVNVIYSALKTCVLGRAAMEGIQRCWRNRNIEWYRPIRNVLINGINLYQYGLNLHHCANSLGEMIHHVASVVTQDGFLNRLNEFLPNCQQTDTSTLSCAQQFAEFESKRLQEGIRWEREADGIQDRWELFSAQCNKSNEMPDTCSQLFWSLERDRYFNGFQWEKQLGNVLSHRAEHWHKFKEICKKINSDNHEACAPQFALLENMRYREGVGTWFSTISKAPLRWEALRSECVAMHEPLERCVRRFWSLESYLYQNNIQWESCLNDRPARWNAFRSICGTEFESKKCRTLFNTMEDYLCINRQAPGLNVRDSLKGARDRWRTFNPNCYSIEGSSEICKDRFAFLEANRIKQNVTDDATYRGLLERWNALTAYLPTLRLNNEEGKQLLWELEKERAIKGVTWEDRLEGMRNRKVEFDADCSQATKGLDLRNLNSCLNLFRTLETSYIKTGKDWLKNWKKRYDDIQLRWVNFHDECEKTHPSIRSCEQIFWEILEPNLYQYNNDYPFVIPNLESDWRTYFSHCFMKQQRSICESDFWKRLFSTIHGAPPSSSADCPPINKTLVEQKDLVDRLNNMTINPQCTPHARFILGLNERSSAKDCGRAYKKLSLEYHPDKCPQEKAKCEKLFPLIGAARETLCPK